MDLQKKDLKYIWHPYTHLKDSLLNIPIVRGEGAYLYDDKGNRYIDAISSWWVNLHGHSHPYIAEKVYEQHKELEHVIFAGFTHPKAVELAERLLGKLPENQSKIFYSDNGSTSVEVAVKMAIQYWLNKGVKKDKIIAFRNSYHGDTFGSMSVSSRSVFTEAFTNYLFDVVFIDPPLKGMEKESYTQMKQALFGYDAAAFVFEPLVQGAGGMLMYEPEPLDELIELCRQNEVLTIADEVMTGFFRTGRFFVSDYLKEKPDILCLSKGLTGGTMPLGVTSCTQKIYDAFVSDDKSKTFYHGHSYTANPLACTAALASLDLLERKECTDNINRISEKHKQFMNSMQNHPSVKDVRQTGTIIAVELNTDEETSYSNEIRDKAYNFFISKNIIMRPLGNIIYIMPPYCISNEDLDYIYNSVRNFLR